MVTAMEPGNERAYQDGVRDERARVLRMLDDAFAGRVLDDDMKTLLAKAVDAIRTGKDGRS